jgi:hypothetical protein
MLQIEVPCSGCAAAYRRRGCNMPGDHDVSFLSCWLLLPGAIKEKHRFKAMHANIYITTQMNPERKSL